MTEIGHADGFSAIVGDRQRIAPTGAMRFALVRVPGGADFHAWVAVQDPANGWHWVKPASSN
jgi:hypothetical protein